MTATELRNHIIRAKCCLADTYYKLAQQRALGLAKAVDYEKRCLLLTVYVEALDNVLDLDDSETDELELCCLTEDEVQNIVENVYRLCDCCNSEVFDDTLLTNLDLTIITKVYD